MHIICCIYHAMIWSEMSKKNGKLPHAVPDLGVSHEICVVRIRVTEVTGFSDSYVHF